ncbi:MAG: hypothetical protein ACE5G2_10245 [Candidatus Krumholzibacteriia bacterium]
MKHVTLEMQGVRLQIRSAYEDLLHYVRLHVPDHIVPGGDPHIRVNVRWAEGDSPDPEFLAFPGQERMDRVGKRLLAGPDSLVWTNTLRTKNLALRFQLDGERLNMDASYFYAPRKKKVEEQPHYRYKKFFGLMSWFVFHPLAWYLEHFRGLYLLHASGMAMSDHGIVIAGVGGVGKTTTGVSLLANGARMVSENLIFHDHERIYSCYEPIRIDDTGVELLGDRRDILRTAEIPDGANHKNLYHVDRRAMEDSVAATALFVPRFTHQGYVRPLEIDDCMERLIAFNELTREVNDFYWFAATLNVLWPTLHSLRRREEALRGLLERVGRWEIGIDRTKGVEPVVQAILERTLGRARPRTISSS